MDTEARPRDDVEIPVAVTTPKPLALHRDSVPDRSAATSWRFVVADYPRFDRDATVAELEHMRRDFHTLLQAASRAGLRRRSAGTRWTNEQLLFHMMFGYLIVLKLLALVRLFSRLPPAVSRTFAGCWTLPPSLSTS